MRDDYRDWLKAEGYADNTCNAQVARVQRLEQSYGPLDDLIASGGYEALFSSLTYSTADERQNRPNPTRLVINGNLRNNFASHNVDMYSSAVRVFNNPSASNANTLFFLQNGQLRQFDRSVVNNLTGVN